MLKRLLQFFGLATTEAAEELPTPVAPPAPAPEPIVEDKPKATRGRKPRAKTGDAPKKAPRKRKPKSE